MLFYDIVDIEGAQVCLYLRIIYIRGIDQSDRAGPYCT